MGRGLSQPDRPDTIRLHSYVSMPLKKSARKTRGQDLQPGRRLKRRQKEPLQTVCKLGTIKY